jgi:hypothetical protein
MAYTLENSEKIEMLWAILEAIKAERETYPHLAALHATESTMDTLNNAVKLLGAFNTTCAWEFNTLKHLQANILKVNDKIHAVPFMLDIILLSLEDTIIELSRVQEVLDTLNTKGIVVRDLEEAYGASRVVSLIQSPQVEGKWETMIFQGGRQIFHSQNFFNNTQSAAIRFLHTI